MKEVQYFCPDCGLKFCTYHHDDIRNTHCGWCNNPVVLTGRISEIVGDEIHVYQDGKLIENRKKKTNV